MENQVKSPLTRWSIPIAIVVAALTVAAALYFGNRFYILERKDETLVKLDRITGTTYEYSQSLGWQPTLKRLLIEEPSSAFASAKIKEGSRNSYNSTVDVIVINETKDLTMPYAVISVEGKVDGKRVVGGTQVTEGYDLEPGWNRSVTVYIHMRESNENVPDNVELKAIVSRAAFVPTRFRKRKAS
jgi:hypothetical protein